MRILHTPKHVVSMAKIFSKNLPRLSISTKEKVIHSVEKKLPEYPL